MGKTRQLGDIVSNGLVSVATTTDTLNIGTGITFFGTSGIASVTGLYVNGTEVTSGGGSGVASTITVADESTDAQNFVVFVNAATGDQNPKTGSNLKFNASTGELTATKFKKSSGGTGFLKADGSEDSSTYLTSYTETQTLDNVVGLGSITTQTITVGKLSVVATGSTATIDSTNTDIIINPSSSGGANSGRVIIQGGLQIDGTTTTVNSTTLTIDDKSIVVASGATDSVSANGAGIEVDGASATFQYAHSGTKWVSNKPIQATSFSHVSGTSTQFLKADGSVDISTYLTHESNDLSSTVTWANVPNANITESSVTQHQAALSITESQISDLQSYLTSYTETQTLNDVVGLGSSTSQAITVGTATTGVVIREDGTLNVSGIATFQSHVKLGDDSNLKIGASDDLELYHNSITNESIIKETGGSNFLIQGTNLHLQSASGEDYFVGTLDGSAALYYNDVKKFETTDDGVIVTGIATATSFVKESNSGGFLKADGTEDTNTYLTTPTLAFKTIAVSGQSDVVADVAADTLTLIAGVGMGITTNASNDEITITNTSSAALNAFKTIAVSGQSDVVADSATDTLTLVAGSNMTITTNASGDSITFASSGGGGGGGTPGGTNTAVQYNNSGSFAGIATLMSIDSANHHVAIGTAIDIIPYDTQENGTLSFEGSAGQLFSITNSLSSGSIFSVNDVSGFPSIDVDADGTIQLAPLSSTEYVGIGTTNPQYKLHVVGNTNIDGTFTVNGSAVSGGGASEAFKTIAVSSGYPDVVADSATDTLTLVAGPGIGITTSASTDTITINNTVVAAQEAFRTIAVSGESNVVADSATDTLTLIAGVGMGITTNASNDEITFNATGGGGGSVTMAIGVRVGTAVTFAFSGSSFNVANRAGGNTVINI